MKKRLLPKLLLVLAGVAGSLQLAAQTPEPSGQWTFDNASDLMAAKVGNVQMLPVVIGNKTVAEATVADAGFQTADGPTSTNGAILVPATSALKIVRAEGAAASTSFTFMLDIMVPDAYPYNGLFQTSPGNANDSEFCIHANQIGANAVGGYYGAIRSEAWHRIVMTNNSGVVKLYVDGRKLTDYATTDARWEIDPVFYLLCDESGERTDTYVSEVAFWETPLTDDQVAGMTLTRDVPWITSAADIKEGDEFHIISDRVVFAGTKTGKQKAMSTAQASYTVNWGDQYVYWGDLDRSSDGFVWIAKAVGDGQWAFLNKEKEMYLGGMNTSPAEADMVFSADPVGYTLTDIKEGEGCFFMTSSDSEHSPHVQGYLMGNRPNNSLAKQNVGDDNYREDASILGYPGRWRFVKIGSAEPVDTRTKIGSVEELAAFAEAVAAGETDIDAVLTADIDLGTGEYQHLMIGDATNMYAGTFDGDGHTIRYQYTTVGSHCGLFCYINGATIRNLYVEGSAKVQGIHFGALFGHAVGEVLIENVVTNVDITGDRGGVTGDGGMTGYNEGTITFNNCATLGSLGYSGTSMYSGFSGYSSDTSTATLNNCYTISALTEGTGTGNCFTFIHGNGTKTFNNCYYVSSIGTVQGTAVEQTEVASGSLCAKLGDGWYQTIGEDAYPVFDASHGRVKEISEAGYASLYLPEPVQIPAGVQAFTGEIQDEWLKLNALTDVVPAKEPVVIKGEAGFYSFVPTTDVENIAGNVLQASDEDIAAEGKYILAKPEGEPVGFYQATTGTIKAGRVFLESTSGVKAFLFAPDGATAITGVDANADASGRIYNLAGQRLQKMQRGINIINGKKILK